MVHDVRGHYFIIFWWRNAKGEVVYNNVGLPNLLSTLMLERYRAWRYREILARQRR